MIGVLVVSSILAAFFLAGAVVVGVKDPHRDGSHMWNGFKQAIQWPKLLKKAPSVELTEDVM